LEAVFKPDVKSRLNEIDVSGFYEDDPEWVSVVAAALQSPESGVVEAVAERLEATTVRVFHGTRTADAGTFLSEGIRLHDRQRMEAEVRTLVGRAKDVGWLETTLEKRFAETAHLTDHGRCYVVVDERVLVQECGHYLLGGSEFLQGIVGPDRAQSLLGSCAPTVIQVDLPLRRVSQSQQNAFASRLIGDWARMLRGAANEARRLDFTFVLREAIAADWVVGHFHPTVVYDPHRMRRRVMTTVTSCKSCRGQTAINQKRA
jgi:hypothetical protein